MALNKKTEFKEKLQNLSEFAKAISHPARLSIFKTIAQKQECICGEIAAVLPLPKPTVSHTGIQIRSTEDVLRVKKFWEELELTTRDENKTSVSHSFFKMTNECLYVTPEIFCRGSQKLEIPDIAWR